MRDADVANLLAVLGDADARHTATLVEVIAATALFKLNPPQGSDVVEVEISEADIAAAMAGYFYTAEYVDGIMKVRLSLDQARLHEAGE